MRLLALAAGLLIAATIVPVSADAGPVRAAARGTATAVAVTGKTAAKGTVVVGRTAVRGTAAAVGPPPGALSAWRPSSAPAAAIILNLS